MKHTFFIFLVSIFFLSCGFYNDPPTASAGLDDTIVLGETVQLDGSASADPDKDRLSFSWTFIQTPSDSLFSSSSILNSSLPSASFVPDVVGTYIVQLTVSDEMFSDADIAAITVNPVVTVPSIPAALQVANPTQTSLTITWDAVADADQYLIYRDITEGGDFTESIYEGTNTIFIDEGLAINTRYYYRVTAKNSAGESVKSSIAAGRTLP